MWWYCGLCVCVYSTVVVCVCVCVVVLWLVCLCVYVGVCRFVRAYAVSHVSAVVQASQS